MINYIPRSFMHIIHLPCSNFILNVALQLTLSSSSCKFSSSALNPCVFGSNLTLSNASRILKAEYSCKTNKKKLEAPWRILFFGTDYFSVKSLQLLCAKYCETVSQLPIVLGITALLRISFAFQIFLICQYRHCSRTNTLISKLDVVSSEKGRYSPVIRFAKEENLVLYHWPIDTAAIKDEYDIGMVVSFGHLIPSKIINSFPLGMINVHGSVLPRWRGAAPIVHAILHGDHETGISIIRVRPKHFDRGEIVRQYRCPISPHDTAGELHERLARIGGELLVECVRDMPRCVLNAPKQPEEGATYAKKIDASYSLIDWNTMSALKVYNLHRALGHIYPLLAQWNEVKVKLHNISLDTEHKATGFSQIQSLDINTASGEHTGYNRHQEVQSPSDNSQYTSTKSNSKHISSALSFLSGSPDENSTLKSQSNPRPSSTDAGTVSFERNRKILQVVCADGKSILCDAITVAGKKRMTAADFNNGFMNKVKEEGRRFVNLDKKLFSVEKT